MSLIKEFLKQKDGDYSQYIPQAYNMTADQKERYTLIENGMTKYELSSAIRCMKPCFKVYETPVVSESESECMNNCVAKSLESLTQLQFHLIQN